MEKKFSDFLQNEKIPARRPAYNSVIFKQYIATILWWAKHFEFSGTETEEGSIQTQNSEQNDVPY